MVWGVGALALASGGLFALRKPALPTPVPVPAVAGEPSPAKESKLPPDGTIRIGLRSLNGRPALRMRLPGGGHAFATEGGRSLGKLPDTPLQVVADFQSGQVLVKGKGVRLQSTDLILAGKGLLQVGSRRYPGKLRLRLEGTGLHLTNELDIEQYLEGVLPGEIPRSFGMEAQKALAVAARSYALVQQGKHGEFDLCDRPCCQMYLGYHRGSDRGLAAVRATRRQCLWSGEDLVYAFYSADCGGISTRVEDVPLKDKPEEPLPYLVPVRDRKGGSADFCASSPYHDWTKRLTLADVERRLNSEPETTVGKLLDLQVEETDATGRVLAVRVKCRPAPEGEASGTAGSAPAPEEKTLDGWQFRRSVGPMTLKSTLYTIDQPQPGVYRFVGKGFGHGLGLCQIGANGMAKQGYDFREILEHYYPGTRVAALDPPADTQAAE